MKKRVYSTDFKSNAVALSYQRDNIKDLANELGVDVQRIYKWRKVSKSIKNGFIKGRIDRWYYITKTI